MTDDAAQSPQETQNSSKHPSFNMKLGNISVAIFSNEKKSATGKTFETQDIVLEKSWKLPDGSYDSRKITLDPKDIMNVNTGLTQAYIAAYKIRHG